MKIVFSGLQPTGKMHIGNYIGAIKQWVKLQEETEAIFCIVDLHAITVPQDPKVLKEKVLEVAALYLACGLDPKKSHIFVQSENPNHPYLTWILNCITPIGQLERLTQFKEKAGLPNITRLSRELGQIKSPEEFKNAFEKVVSKVDEILNYAKSREQANAGLFDYPVLMASDILLYQTDEVPVGEDQKQHIELTRDVAEKFNKTYGETFKLPKPLIQKQTARIMSLQNPNVKMSKSDIDPLGTINLLDSEQEIRDKVKRAVTDSQSSVSKSVHNKEEGAIPNLLTIYAAFSDSIFEEVLNKFDGVSYSEFKQKLGDLLVEKLKPIQERYQETRNNEQALRKVLDEGRNFAVEKSSEILEKVKEKVGLS
ncbi:MAG: tryptophan--tRNA ligase [Candidatus Levybacteria bacterium RBG_16_35_11]|nr:MAG: tryptophan--tRNA ligase [Candidatus Levybacteria bacterium RBG_16_35_11]